jgi:hypothetical protein
MDQVIELLLTPRHLGRRLPPTTLLPEWYRQFSLLSSQNQFHVPIADCIKETNLLASILRQGARHGLCEDPQALVSQTLHPHRIPAGPERERSFIQHWRDTQDCVSGIFLEFFQ